MIVSDERRALFIHIPKTGGASVEQVLRETLPDARTVGKERHPRLRRALQLDPGLAPYWTFGFVRNPWARMWSWWSMIDRWNQRLGPASGKPQTETDGTRAGNRLWRAVAEYADFEEFVLRGTEEIPRLAMTQRSFLHAGGKEADFTGRTEHLARDLAVVQEHLGLPVVAPPRRNSWSKGPWQEAYTAASRARIAEVYAEDIEGYGYEFR